MERRRLVTSATGQPSVTDAGAAGGRGEPAAGAGAAGRRGERRCPRKKSQAAGPHVGTGSRRPDRTKKFMKDACSRSSLRGSDCRCGNVAYVKIV